MSDYDRNSIKQWIWMYKPYKFINGFIIRIFGVYFNVRENNSTEKLLNMLNYRK